MAHSQLSRGDTLGGLAVLDLGTAVGRRLAAEYGQPVGCHPRPLRVPKPRLVPAPDLRDRPPPLKQSERRLVPPLSDLIRTPTALYADAASDGGQDTVEQRT